MPLSFHQSIIVTALSCTAGLLLFSGTGRAQSETFSANSYLGAANTSAHYKLPTFDTDLGTLESVDVTLQYNVCPVITIDNTTSAPAAFTGVSLTLPITANLPGGLDSVTPETGTLSAGTVQPGTTTYNLTRIIDIFSETVNADDFTNWEGLPNQKLTFVITPGNSTTQGTSASGVTITGTSTEWAKVSVTYDYIATAAAPEPSGRLLSFIVGAAMLVGIGRRVRMRMQAA